MKLKYNSKLYPLPQKKVSCLIDNLHNKKNEHKMSHIPGNLDKNIKKMDLSGNHIGNLDSI